MNYSELTNKSDAELNFMVAEKRFPDATLISQEPASSVNVYPDGLMNPDSRFCFDFNNPSDAWPIILENKIDIRFSTLSNYCESFKRDIFSGEPLYCADDANPLRAAMIVFLMMEDK